MKNIELDENKIQEMAEKYAIQGAEQAIKNFYTGYDSPFMKKVEKELADKVKTNLFFNLPLLTAAINQAINDKITEMANTIVANTFLPMLNRMFTQEPKTVVTTQDLYEHFGDVMRDDLDDEFDPDLMELDIKCSDDTFRYLSFRYDGNEKFRLSLMQSSRKETDEYGNILYMITALPGCSQYHADYYPRERQMRLRLKDDVTLEMPFVPDVLRDEFMRYVASLLLNNTKVIIKEYHEYIVDNDY